MVRSVFRAPRIMALAFLVAATSVAAQTPIAPDKAYSMLSGMATPGVAIGKVLIEGDRAIVSGTAQSNSQVSSFMRAIDASADLDKVELRSISAGGSGVTFELTVQVACQHGLARSGPQLCARPAGKTGGVHKCRVDGTVTFQATPCAPGQEG